jgi:spermidine synthase
MNATTPAHQSIQLASYSNRALSLVGACFVLSGATGLIYEVLWARMLGLVFGATTIAISAVLAAFMGGLALGSEIAGRLGSRIRRPLLAYGIIELAVGLYALAVPFFFRGIDSVYASLWARFHPGFYGFAFSKFLLASLALALPTTLMGATLPVLSAALARSRRGSSVTRFYTYNLAGAIIGAIVAGFVLLPFFGVRATIWIGAAINLAIGLGAVVIDSKLRSTAEGFENVQPTSEPHEHREAGAAGVKHGQVFWLACAFVSGFVTFSVQVAWSRLLAMIIGSSTYAFSIVVALFLLGLSFGAYLVSRGKGWTSNGDSLKKLRRAVFAVEVLTASSLCVSLWITNLIPQLLILAGFKLGVNSWSGLLALQVFAATLLVLVPAVLMGMVMPLVLVWAGAESATSATVAGRVGRSYAVNTVGAIAGSVATAFVLIPIVSTRLTILFAAALCLAVAGVAYLPRREGADLAVVRAFSVGAVVALILLMLIFTPPMNKQDLSVGAYDSYVRVLAKARGRTPQDANPNVPEEHQLLMYKEGTTATVSVRRDWGVTSLAINGRTNASDRDDMPTQIMLAQAGVLTAPRLDNAMIVGFATGVTAGSMLQSPIQSIDCVEIERAAVASSHYFDHVNNRPLDDPRTHLIIDDARTRLRVNPRRYDIIVSEPSHPWVPGVANLFTREFFAVGRDRLGHDGVFVQWLQIYQLSTESLRSVLATFHEVFPRVLIFRVRGEATGKDLILVGSGALLNLNHVAERMSNPRIAADLARAGIKSPDDLRAWLVCNETQLGPAVVGAIINTDDNMHVETMAPREAFRPLMEENAAWIESLARKYLGG